MLKRDFFNRILGKESTESVERRCDKERDNLRASLSVDDFRKAAEKGICLLEDHCTHYFTLAHDAYRAGEKNIFLCWNLKSCLCIIKERIGCEQCFYKNQFYSLCWKHFEKEPIQLNLA